VSSGNIFGTGNNYSIDSSWNTSWCFGTPCQLLLNFIITAWELNCQLLIN